MQHNQSVIPRSFSPQNIAKFRLKWCWSTKPCNIRLQLSCMRDRFCFVLHMSKHTFHVSPCKLFLNQPTPHLGSKITNLPNKEICCCHPLSCTLKCVSRAAFDLSIHMLLHSLSCAYSTLSLPCTHHVQDAPQSTHTNLTHVPLHVLTCRRQCEPSCSLPHTSSPNMCHVQAHAQTDTSPYLPLGPHTSCAFRTIRDRFRPTHFVLAQPICTDLARTVKSNQYVLSVILFLYRPGPSMPNRLALLVPATWIRVQPVTLAHSSNTQTWACSPKPWPTTCDPDLIIRFGLFRFS
jgi:hypothetical protein